MDMKNTIGRLNVSAFEKARPMAPSLGEILVASGRLPADAVSRVAARQQERGIPFGEAAVELGFQVFHHGAQARLGDVQLLGRAGEVALFGDRQKLAHVFEIHGASWFGSQYLTSIGSQKFGIGRYDRSALSLAAEAAALKKN